MGLSEAKKIYHALRESGDLRTVYTGMSGDWDKDRKSFMKQYEKNEEWLSDSLGDLGLEEDEFLN